jgi:lysyl-tRNA synthetase class II
MQLVLTTQIDPKDYPFKKFIDDQAHLDTDELRHSIKTVSHHIETDFKGNEHLYCDKTQLDANGKWKRPKIMTQAETKGFKTPIDMIDADKKAQEDAKVKEVSDLREFTAKQNDVIQKLIDKQDTLEKTIIDQNNLLQEIINRLKK